MKQILLVTGNPQTLAICHQVLVGEAFSDIRLVSCAEMTTEEELLEAVVGCDADVVIARGTRAAVIGDRLPVTIVDLSVTALDLLRALEQAREHGTTVGLIGSETLLCGSEKLAQLLNLTIRTYPMSKRDNIQELVTRAVKDGVDVIVGGYTALMRTVRANCPVVPIGTDADSILQSIEEARRISAAIAEEKHQRNLMRSFLEHSYSGLVAVDRQSTVFIFNPSAQRALQIPETQAIGRNLDDVCRPLSLRNVMDTGQDDTGAIVTHNNTTYICEKVVVRVDEKIVGALAVFQDVNQLRNTEASVRRKIFETGLVADGTFDAILGEHQAIRHAVDCAKEFAITDSSVLLLGETGTGKELFAQSIHNYSKRSNGPFVAINCAALPAELLESELFGYESGAFTGARSKGKPGMFELAHGGTLFLDEIGEMDLQIQGKFLRALQERKIMRLGSDKVLPVDVRLITATNRNLLDCIARGVFRRDLYYRLNVLKLLLPPLRNCLEDIAILAKAFLRRHTSQADKPVQLTASAVRALQRHSWPGNVRELYNFMERLAAMYGRQGKIDGGVIEALFAEDESMMGTSLHNSPPAEDDLAEIYRVLAITNGNYTQAARILGLSRVTLWRKLQRNTKKGGAAAAPEERLKTV